ncbi:Zn-dependent hydrolase of the beta-lactamase [Rhypophila sp. PSN 637]
MSPLQTALSITHIDTACAILSLDDLGINFLTDPVFCPAGTQWDMGIAVLTKPTSPALSVAEMPPIDAVLLSHEDHPDNLDEAGRMLLDARRVLTTPDGARKLAPRPGVRGLQPWEKVDLTIGGRTFAVTGTPCVHLPGGEVTGFVITAREEFGEDGGGKPNAIYFSGDTVYLPEVAARLREEFHVAVAVLNIGRAQVSIPGEAGPRQITLGGKEAARLFREIGADVLVPIHYEDWGHFSERGDDLREVLKGEGLGDEVCWLERGVKKRLV